MLTVATTVADHGEDFLIGLNPLTNQVMTEFDSDIYPFALPPSAEPLLSGWALDDPGILALEPEDVEPGEFELLDPAADVYLQVLDASYPEMKMWDPLAPGEAGFQIVGDNLLHLGSGDFHVHAWFHIDDTETGFSVEHFPLELTFQLIDQAGIHLPSDPVSVTFTPEPASLGLLLLTGLLRWRCRR